MTLPGGDPPTAAPAGAAGTAGVLRMYRRQARIYDMTRWIFLRGRRRALDRLLLAEGSRALEVGCGTGLNLGALRERVGPSGEVHGLDLSPEMLSVARGKAEARQWDNVRLHLADAQDFDLGVEFDAVLYSYSLAMIQDWRASLAAAARHLRARGRLSVLDFHRMEGWGPVGRLFVRWLNRWHVDPERPCARALGEILGSEGVDEQIGPAGWYFVATAVKPDA